MVKPATQPRSSKKLFLLALGAIAIIGVALIAMQARGSGPSPRHRRRAAAG